MTCARAVAVAQTIPVRGNVDTNIEQHLGLIRIAADEQAQVLVFPELSLTGYELDIAPSLAFAQDDPRLDRLMDAASSAAMTLVVGAPVRVGARLCIGACIISRDRTVGWYTKQHLGAFSQNAACDGAVPVPEATVFDPGTENPLVHFAGNTAALAVCADTGRPSHPQAAAERGARTYLASMFVIPSELERETANLRAYAQQHAFVVAFANYGGPSGGLAAAGRSAIWSADGTIVARLATRGMGVAVATESRHGWRGRTVMVGD
jgi:predicted amidohydrolase